MRRQHVRASQEPLSNAIEMLKSLEVQKSCIDKKKKRFPNFYLFDCEGIQVTSKLYKTWNQIHSEHNIFFHKLPCTSKKKKKNLKFLTILQSKLKLDGKKIGENANTPHVALLS